MNDLSQPATKQDFAAHAKDDHDFQVKQTLTNEGVEKSLQALHERMTGLATKEDIANVATKEDIESIRAFLKTVKVGSGILGFSFNNASKIGSFILLILGAVILIKYGIMGGLLWITTHARL